MRVYEILWGMHGAKNGAKFMQGLERLKEVIEKLNRDGPFIVRIITESKYYNGLLEEAEINERGLKFRIRDCDRNGRTNSTGRIYQKQVSFSELKDIQIVADENGNTLFFSDLFPETPHSGME
jgi:hypothetical protein